MLNSPIRYLLYRKDDKSLIKYDILAVIAIIVLVIVIYLANFHGNFFISGWDNLHPEFNFKLNLQRAWDSAWQEYQGLGVPAGHGHAAELARVLFLIPFSWIMPLQAVRKLYLVLSLFIGSWGMYVLLSRRVLNITIKFNLVDYLLNVVGAIYYIFNLITIQIFYVPYEAFIHHFAFLPWLALSVYSLGNHTSKKNIVLTFFLFIIASPQFYIPTLFIVVGFLLLFISLSVYQTSIIRRVRFSLLVMGLFVVTNSYWFLPFLYYNHTNIQSQIQAHVNNLYSEDTYLKNVKYGSIDQIIMLKSSLFDSVDLLSGGTYGFIMQSWRDYTSVILIRFISYLLFLISMIGAVKILWKSPVRIFGVLFLLFLGTLAINSYPFSMIDSFLRSTFPLFNQVFRNSFTKFSNSFLIFYVIAFVIGMRVAISIMDKIINSKWNKRYLYACIGSSMIMIIISVFPIFSGSFIFKKMKVKIPQEYFQLFSYLNTQEDGRIANLPQNSISGWTQYSWDYGGSGFLWYGIGQPILDRAFDVWHKNNENYYWEITKALYSKNDKQIMDVLYKYDVHWVLFDRSVTGGDSKSRDMSSIIDLLVTKGNLKIDKIFNYINLYEVLAANPENSYISTITHPIFIEPVYEWNDYDHAYSDYGSYFSTNHSADILEKTEITSHIMYPFRSLFFREVLGKPSFSILENDDYFIFSTLVPKSIFPSKYNLSLPRLDQDEITEILPGDDIVINEKKPEVLINGTSIGVPLSTDNTTNIELTSLEDLRLEVYVPKQKGMYSYAKKFNDSSVDFLPRSCDTFNKEQYQYDFISEGKRQGLRLTSLSSSNCLDIPLSNLIQKLGYLLKIEARNVEGKNLFISFYDQEAKRNTFEMYLPDIHKRITYIPISPSNIYGYGYSLHLDNISIGNRMTVNDIVSVEVYPLPYTFLTGIKIVEDPYRVFTESAVTTSETTVSSIHVMPSTYDVILKKEDNNLSPITLVLSQSYDKGWKAYQIQCQVSGVKCQVINAFPFLFGEELTEHVLVNNWENGWLLNNETMKQFNNETIQIKIIYLPQYLEYVGFGLLFITAAVILFPRKH